MSTKTNTTAMMAAATLQTNEDFKNALVIVSVSVNLFIFVAWLVAQMSAEYSSQLASLI